MKDAEYVAAWGRLTAPVVAFLALGWGLEVLTIRGVAVAYALWQIFIFIALFATSRRSRGQR
jgi:hypothetical protein